MQLDNTGSKNGMHKGKHRTIYVGDVFLNKQINPPKKRKFSRPGKLLKLTCIQTARSAVHILSEDIHSIPSVPLKTGK